MPAIKPKSSIKPKGSIKTNSPAPAEVDKAKDSPKPNAGAEPGYKPLHHKYRPQTFAELVGQEAIAITLSNALRQQRIAPAYLFTGVRGTGKTSSARIFAKSLNCLNSDVPTKTPCGACEVCRAIAKGAELDVVEIDAATNTGVDNIRELIERTQFAPVQCRYKVFIIDEVHMLSTAAFNALLKTLEEPPNRVVFVLATTDPQKVLPTIISRCHRFDFQRIPLNEIVEQLKAIACKEEIDITPDAVQLVAQISQGGMRDAESLLDQLSLLEGQITVSQIWDLVGSVPEPSLLELTELLLNGNASDSENALKLLHTILYEQGKEPAAIITGLLSMLRNLQIAAVTENDEFSSVMPDTWESLMTLAEVVSISQIVSVRNHIRTSEYAIRSGNNPILMLECALLDLMCEEDEA